MREMIPRPESDTSGISTSGLLSHDVAQLGRDRNRYFQLAVALLILNCISGLLFISLVKRPVFDDPNNYPDVERYATQGVNLATLRDHINPTGPTSFIWMAAAVRTLGGDGLRDARLAILLSWVLLGAGLLFGARYTSFPNLWYGALVVTLVFLHTLIFTATVTTEGPAMLFVLFGTAAWLESMARPITTRRSLLLGVAGGFSMGLAITCRQYYLALLPAALVLSLFQLRALSSSERKIAVAKIAVSLSAAILPVLVLVLVWKSFSSPSMVSGVSYGTWKSKVGLNMIRPSIAAFYTLLYLVPLSLPELRNIRLKSRKLAILLAALGGTVAIFLSSWLLQPGPLNSTIQALKRLPFAGRLLFGMVCAVTLFNAFALGARFWEKRDCILSCPPAAFASLTILFFLAEQIGVGGNIPFYELYVLQVAPFLGILVFYLLPRLTPSRLLLLLAMSLLSHALLWRFALGG